MFPDAFLSRDGLKHLLDFLPSENCEGNVPNWVESKCVSRAVGEDGHEAGLKS